MHENKINPEMSEDFAKGVIAGLACFAIIMLTRQISESMMAWVVNTLSQPKVSLRDLYAIHVRDQKGVSDV